MQHIERFLTLTDDELQAMTKEELIQRITALRDQYFNPTTAINEVGNNNNHHMMQQLLIQSRRQAEFLENINRILTNLSNPRTLMKILCVIMFLNSIPKLPSIRKFFWLLFISCFTMVHPFSDKKCYFEILKKIQLRVLLISYFPYAKHIIHMHIFSVHNILFFSFCTRPYFMLFLIFSSLFIHFFKLNKWTINNRMNVNAWIFNDYLARMFIFIHFFYSMVVS